MRSERRERRRQEIEAAAYALLAEKGYKATSMLSIAKRASASNETLYKWYGTKAVLFRAMVDDNAKGARNLLEEFRAEGADPLGVVRRLGPILLGIVTDDKAIALNRAAAGDVYETGQLGEAIAAGGKRTVLPLLREVFDQARAAGLMDYCDQDDVAEIYLSLLIGDLQIARVIGVQPPLTKAEINARAERACQLLLRLLGA